MMGLLKRVPLGPARQSQVSPLPTLLAQFMTSMLASRLFLSLLVTPSDQGLCTCCLLCLNIPAPLLEGLAPSLKILRH